MKPLTQNVSADHGPSKNFKMPARMLRAYKHSTNEERSLFDTTYQRLTEAGLSFYPTNRPDLRARHPQNDIVFVLLGFQEVSGTRIEIRVDTCPRTFISQDVIRPWRVRKYDQASKAIWAVYRIGSLTELEPPMTVIERVRQIRPRWGN